MLEFLGIGKSTAVIIGYVIISIIASGALYSMYNAIKKNGQYEVIISTQEAAIKKKDKDIKDLQDIIILNDKIIQERDQELTDLEKKYEGILDNLGDGVDDQAVDSLKEYFNRIGK